jgi:hypothetical protein
VLLGRLRGHLLDRVEVHSRAKGFACAGEDSDARGAALDLPERRENLFDHLRRNRVAFLGAVEGEQAEFALEFELQRLEGIACLCAFSGLSMLLRRLRVRVFLAQLEGALEHCPKKG